MEAYSAFAYVYDKLMKDVDYEDWTNYIEDIFKRYGVSPKNMAELACGTGNLTNKLANRGYHLLGVDYSEDMLSIAQEKAMDVTGGSVIYLHQDMRELCLPTELDAILCVCDGMNYITKDEDLIKIFKSAYKHLKSGGLFIFDVSSYYKLSTILGQNTYAENYEGVSYIWENYFDERNSICDFDLTIFVKEGNTYKKYEEKHEQRAHKEMEIVDKLRSAGFEKIHMFDAFGFEEPRENSERIYFISEKI